MFNIYRCCNTCDDVKRAYKMKNWDFHPSNIEQCKNQKDSKDMPDNAFKEGCQIYGSLQVNRVSTENMLKLLEVTYFLFEYFLGILTKSIL